MNSPHSDTPRFACRVARRLLTTLGRTDGESPRGLGSGHVAGCPDCQQFFSACDDLDAALTRDAARLPPHFPAGLEHRISLAVARAASDEGAHSKSSRDARASRSSPTPARPGLPMFALLAAAACTAIGLFLYQKVNQPAATPPTDLVAAIDSTRAIFATHPLRTKVMDTIDSAASAADPLTSEVQAIRADARSALRFLALNFLPADPDTPPAPRRRSG